MFVLPLISPRCPGDDSDRWHQTMTLKASGKRRSAVRLGADYVIVILKFIPVGLLSHPADASSLLSHASRFFDDLKEGGGGAV